MIAEAVEPTNQVELTRHRFSVGEYLKIVEASLLGEDSRVELLWGKIVEKSPIHVAHTSTLNQSVWLLTNILGKQVILGVQNPVQLDDKSLPQPDVAVLQFQNDFYKEQYPGPDDTLLLNEVADSSLRYDQRIRSKLYGAAGIADYWIVNLSARQIEVYREPQQDGYRTVTRYAPGESLSPLAIPDVSLSAIEILGMAA